ncbi:hypothetical protein G3496_03590 [Shewanella baltica]|uniref:hypothetical protein n=1 Tax=Shewanella baltica TaxID=62322 RepID=UPI00217DDB56|nr:hypothetical protein [Shewanella baltica]MCS6134007.1 hypothetical protein [Shewanella baltica]
MDKLAPQIMAIEDKQIARNLWYLTWVVIDCVSIVLVLLTHKRFKLLASELTRFISHTYAVLIAVQALRFFDRMLIETDLLGAFYMYAIPTLDIAVIAVSLIWLLGHLKQHKHNTGS